MGAKAYIRDLGGQFDEIEQRVQGGKSAIPADGMSVASFGLAFLGEVPPMHFEAVAMALGRRGVVWFSQAGGMSRVYAAKPQGYKWAEKARPVYALYAKLTRYFVDLQDSISKDDYANIALKREAGAVQASIVSHISDHCFKYIQNGLTLREIRSSIISTLSEKQVAVISLHEPALHPHSDADDLAIFHPKISAKADVNASNAEKLYYSIQRWGENGATVTQIRRRFGYGMGKNAFDAALEELVDTKMIVAEAKLGSGRRRAVHYSAAG